MQSLGSCAQPDCAFVGPAPAGMTYLPSRAETTNPETAAQACNRKWLTFRPGRVVLPGFYWAFVDGSSHGMYAVVVLDGNRPNDDPVCVTGFRTPTHTRNVGAELNALLLALRKVPSDKPSVIVHDYLGVSAWVVGAWKIKNAEVYWKTQAARQLVSERELHVEFVHHAGHQRDVSDFTAWNNHVDKVCSEAQRNEH